MTSDDDNQKTDSKESNFSQRIIILSFAILYLGIIFVFGQSSLLGFEYLSTFEYSDFLLSSALLVPFFLFILFGATAVGMFVLEPLHHFSKTRTALASNTWTKNKQAIRSLFDFGRIVSLPLFLIITSLWFMNHILIGLIFYLSVMILTHLIEKLWTRNLADEPNIDYDEKDSVSEFLDATLDYLIGSQPGWVLMTLLVFGFGQLYIEFQDKEIFDATLSFSKDVPAIDVNILASNSNVLVIFSDEKIQLIPRTQVTKIEYKYNSIYGRD